MNVRSVTDLKIMSEMNQEQTKFQGKRGILRRLWNFITCSGNITFIEYAPHIFSNILRHDKVNTSYLLKSFNLSMNISNISKLQISEGKSGSFFFFTYDNKFLIKTISTGERKALLGSFLKKYYYNIKEESNGISTLMGRIYGVFTLKIGFFSSVDVILMENLCPVGSEVKNN
jgi:1-phosphatidylinositol-4-phosphate 5-kinase